MNGLKALEENRTLIHTFTSGNALIEYDKNEEIIRKELKVFDIVREMFFNGTDVTKVLLSIYQSKDFEEFQQTHLFANKDKYDLLKEVLSDGQ